MNPVNKSHDHEWLVMKAGRVDNLEFVVVELVGE